MRDNGTAESARFYNWEKVHSKGNVIVKVLFWPNSGGTVAALWNSWAYYLKPQKIRFKTMSIFEDDIYPNLPNFLEVAESWIQKHNLDLFGVVYCHLDPKVNEVLRTTGQSYPNHKARAYMVNTYGKRLKCKNDDGRTLRWVSDPYFLSYDAFSRIEKVKGGKFTHFPIIDRYSPKSHGVVFGEVGFSNSLHQAGMKIRGHITNRTSEIMKKMIPENESFCFHSI